MSSALKVRVLPRLRDWAFNALGKDAIAAVPKPQIPHFSKVRREVEDIFLVSILLMSPKNCVRSFIYSLGVQNDYSVINFLIAI